MTNFGTLNSGTDELSRYANDIARSIADADESDSNAGSAYTVTSFVVATVDGKRVGEMAEDGESGWTFTADTKPTWDSKIRNIESTLGAMNEDDRNDAVEALRSIFDESLYTRTTT
jgi:hypothetical protein